MASRPSYETAMQHTREALVAINQVITPGVDAFETAIVQTKMPNYWINLNAATTGIVQVGTSTYDITDVWHSVYIAGKITQGTQGELTAAAETIKARGLVEFLSRPRLQSTPNFKGGVPAISAQGTTLTVEITADGAAPDQTLNVDFTLTITYRVWLETLDFEE